MGVDISGLLVRKEVSVDELTGKTFIVDGPLWLYQFISSIRGRDGSLLTDSSGGVTSHLVGLSSRVPKLLEKGLKLAVAFDGEMPELKRQERERRKELKIDAKKKYDQAVAEGNIEDMRKYASRTARLTSDMINESKELLASLGVPIIDAPSEAEAQASHIVSKGDAYAVATSDADCMMFGSPKIVRNLNIAGRRKVTSKLAYESVNPELVDLSDNLNSLGIDQNQLIALGMLVGTDFNYGGIKGIGPKNGLKLVKEFGDDLDGLFKKVEWNTFFSYPWSDVYYQIKKMPVTDDYKLDFGSFNADKVKELLVEKHDFSSERISRMIEKLMGEQEKRKQTGLGDFF